MSCDLDAPQVGSTRSDWTRVVKVNHRKTIRRETRLYCTAAAFLSRINYNKRTKKYSYTSAVFKSSRSYINSSVTWSHYIKHRGTRCYLAGFGKYISAFGRIVYTFTFRIKHCILLSLSDHEHEDTIIVRKFGHYLTKPYSVTSLKV